MQQYASRQRPRSMPAKRASSTSTATIRSGASSSSARAPRWPRRMSSARPRPAEGSPSPRRSRWLGRAIPLRHCRGNPEGTPARPPESTGGHPSSGDSFLSRDFLARGVPAFPPFPPRCSTVRRGRGLESVRGLAKSPLPGIFRSGRWGIQNAYGACRPRPGAPATGALTVATTSLQAAIAEVATRDPVLARLISRVGPITHRPRDPDGPFGALVRAIVYQQLAGRAAQAIHGRLRTTVGETLTPETLAATPDQALRT